MSAFDIKIEGFDKLMDVLQNRPQEIKAQIGAEFEAAGYEIQDYALSHAPNDQGVIARSLSVNVAGELQVEVVCPVKYAPYQEFGTRGKTNIPPELSDLASQYQGATGASFQDLLQAILGWVRRNGITGTYSVKTHKRLGGKQLKTQQDMEAAYPIALSIVKNGIPAQPFFFPGFFEVKPKLIEKIKTILTA